MVESQKRTLKILCLHGFNTSAEVFQYQYRHFKQVYGDIMEFHVLDAPHELIKYIDVEMMIMDINQVSARTLQQSNWLKRGLKHLLGLG